MNGILKYLIILFLITGLIEVVYGAEAEYPWVYRGYEKLNELHFRYYYVFGYAIESVLTGEKSWDDSIKDNTAIVEVWFRKDKNMFRLDRYIENLGVECNSYEGEPPATIPYNGKTYSLYDRIIQKGLSTTRYTFNYKTQTEYSDKGQVSIVCGYYDKYDSEAYKEPDPEFVIDSMTTGHESRSGFSIYAPMSTDSKELETSAFGLIKLMDSTKYNKILEGWKVKETIAGRTAVKNYNSPPSFWGAEGYQFIDTELGIGLAGYLEGCRASDTYKETKFEEPKRVYEALVVETTVSPDVFEKF